MSKYIIKRLLICVMILFFVTLIIYSIMRCIPTSFVESIARERAALPGGKSYQEWLAQLNAAYGMDKGILEGYFTNWLPSAIKADFGDSWFFNVPVVDKFNTVIWNSFTLSCISFVLEILIAIPLGIVAASKQYSRTDYAITVFALIGISLPTFFFATILKYVFSIKLGWLDLFGQVNAESAGLKHISGTGGQLDFVMGAYLSKGGKSFICMSSTVTGKDGTVKSRIVPTLTPGSICTDPRSCVHYIVTEYGMVNLKGLSTWERAEALISIAHPDFREQLIQDAEKMHIWRRSNK